MINLGAAINVNDNDSNNVKDKDGNSSSSRIHITDKAIYAKLRAEKVYVTMAAVYRCEEAGWFRLVIAHPGHVLQEGLRRVVRVVGVLRGRTGKRVDVGVDVDSAI